jgi:hypothetical protein
MGIELGKRLNESGRESVGRIELKKTFANFF